MKKSRLSGLFSYFDPAGVRKYVTQVSLILVSLLIATRAEKCRQTNKDEQKVHEYLLAVQADIEEEIKIDGMNLRDCKNDIKALYQFLRLCNSSDNDSLYSALNSFGSVYQRGVFRAFPPSTFDIMIETGDASLLKNLPLRNELASVFAFRQNVIRKDLEIFDEETNRCAEKLARFLDLAVFLGGEKEQMLLDRNGFIQDPHNEVFLLFRNANLRAFHLETAIENLETTQKMLKEYIETL